MLQGQINKLEALTSLASQAMENEDFVPTTLDYRFLVDTLVDCLDRIKAAGIHQSMQMEI